MKKNSHFVFAITLGLVSLAPLSAFAAGIDTTIVKGYADSIINLINNILVPTLLSIAFIVFLWGVFKYFILNGDSESDKAEGRKFAMWGVIGFAVILSVWGLVNVVVDTFGFNKGSNPQPPIIKLP